MQKHDDLRNLIRDVIKESVVKFTKGSVKKKSEFQILDLLIPTERKIRSVVGGLETAMGRTFWELLSKKIAATNNFIVVDDVLKVADPFPGHVTSLVSRILEDRKGGFGGYTGQSSKEDIKKECIRYISNPIGKFSKPNRGFGVDVWLKKDGIDYLFDIKTVQPNVKEFGIFLEQIMNWRAYFYTKYPTGQCDARIVFPYNPYQIDFWLKCKGTGKPLDKDVDAYVEDEYWDLLSGIKGTFLIIREAFDSLRRERTLDNEFDLLFGRKKNDLNNINSHGE